MPDNPTPGPGNDPFKEILNWINRKTGGVLNPPEDGEKLKGPSDVETGLDYEAMVSSAGKFIATPQGAIVAGLLLAGVALIALPAILSAAPVLGAAAAGFFAGALGTAGTAAGGAVVGAAAPGLGALEAIGGIALAGAIIHSGYKTWQSFNPLIAKGTPQQTDPLLLDLNGDGIKTTNFTNGVFFDHDGNNFSELTTWVDSHDGILAIDKNNNGTIDNGNEIFGNNTTLSNSTLAADGYAALADLDSNSDGAIDSNDTAFSQLRVLKGDGNLLTLAQAGIQSLNLSHTATNTVDGYGNTQVSLGSYIKADNSTAAMGDFNLLTNTKISIPELSVIISSTIEALPDSIGSGNVYSLHTAMAMDTSGTLQGLVEDFIAATTETARNSYLEQILDQWSGVSETGIRNGGMILADHVAVVDQFEGEAFQGDFGFDGIGAIPAAYLSQAYYELAEELYGKLMAQSTLSSYFGDITWAQNPTTGAYSLNLDSVITDIQTLASTDPSSASAVAAEFSRAILGLGWERVSNYLDFYSAMSTLGFKDAIDQAGRTVVTGTSSADSLGSFGSGPWNTGTGLYSRDTRAYYLNGAAGDDTIKGSYNDDILIGGTGNDTLIGYDGNDAYYFNLGDGQDTIIEGNAYITSSNSGYDSVFFGAGIAPGDVTYTRSGNDMVVTISGTGDQITISNLFSSQMGYYVEQFAFANGTIVTTDSILFNMALNGTSGNDTLSITDAFAAHGQKVYGFDGNDYLEGGLGNDLIDGGNGSDTLNGGGGLDTLLGQDGNDYLIAGDGNSSLDGGTGADNLTGGAGKDTLIGGTGNDTLNGGNGDDQYVFASSFGSDTVSERFSSGNDTLVFNGINQSQATFSGVTGSSDDLVISIGSDQILVNSGLLASGYGAGAIENYQFADGTLNFSQILSQLQMNGTSGDDFLNGSKYGETLNGLDGNDFLFGNGGNDTMFGGNGNDYLFADFGNDSLNGGIGNDFILAYGGNDTLVGGTGNDTLYGDAGNDTYLFALGDGMDTISDNSGSNTLIFDSNVIKADIAFFQNGSNLQVGFINSSGDQLTTNSMSDLSKIQLSDGQYLTSADVNLIIQDMSSYATTNSVSLTSLSDVERNSGLMAIINGAWHAA